MQDRDLDDPIAGDGDVDRVRENETWDGIIRAVRWLTFILVPLLWIVALLMVILEPG